MYQEHRERERVQNKRLSNAQTKSARPMQLPCISTKMSRLAERPHQNGIGLRAADTWILLILQALLSNSTQLGKQDRIKARFELH